MKRGVFALSMFVVAALSGAGNVAGKDVANFPLTLAGTDRDNAVYPLRVGPTRRYLVDRRGRPFMIVGDSPQSIIVNLSLAEAERFLASRQAAGFNAIWVNLICNTGTAGRPNGTTYDGIAPFTSLYDLATPNEAYFQRADAMIRLAAKHGMTVFLNPAEVAGWLGWLVGNGVAKDFEYGRYLGERYRTFPNLVWFNGNDFQSWSDRASDEAALAVARGIKATDPNHIQTVELDYPTSGSLDDKRWRQVISLDAAYTYYPTYAQLLKEYTRRDFLPTFMVEANYEFEHDYTGPQTLRRQEYWTMLSGATGQFYGHRYTWQFLNGWESVLNTKPVAQLKYVKKLFAPRPWFKLVPDLRHSVVVAGYGHYTTKGSVNDSDYVTTARTPDGKLAISYLPTLRKLTVNLRTFSGRVRARWYDPTTGRFSAIRGSPFANSGRKSFTPPGKNGDGDSDWVLVLTAA
jgi:hypothetical protein